MFELKKVVSALLMPLPAFLIIGLLGLALVSFTTNRKTGCFVILFAFVGIFLISFQPVSTRLLMPLERLHSAFLPGDEKIDFVMVLGSGHVVDDQIPPTSELSRTALMRLTEGIRIMRLYPGSKLILSGYSGATEVSNARMMARVAIALGVAKSDIVLLEHARDTWEESRNAASYVKDKNLVLVTSASHMKRALLEFKSAGLNPLPAPTNYLAHDNIVQPWEKYKPRARYLEQTEMYWHETLGYYWQVLRDKMYENHLVVNEEPLFDDAFNSEDESESLEQSQ